MEILSELLNQSNNLISEVGIGQRLAVTLLTHCSCKCRELVSYVHSAWQRLRQEEMAGGVCSL